MQVSEERHEILFKLMQTLDRMGAISGEVEWEEVIEWRDDEDWLNMGAPANDLVRYVYKPKHIFRKYIIKEGTR